jgi:hypothetical protein
MKSAMVLLERIQGKLCDIPREQRLQLFGKQLLQELALAVGHANSDISYRDLCRQWQEPGRRQRIVEFLAACHPCVTAMVIVQGHLDAELTSRNVFEIVNGLVDLRVDEIRQAEEHGLPAA